MDRRVEVEPDDAALDADDAAPPPVARGEAGGLEHALVVRELQQVALVLARLGVLRHRMFEPGRRQVRGARALAGLEREVMRDVGGAVPAVARLDQEIGPPDAAADLVDRQARAEDQGRAGSHRFDGGLLAVHRDGIRVGGEEDGDDVGLEGDAAIHQAAREGRLGERFSRAQDVVLRAHGAVLGDVAALGRDGGDVVAGSHRRTV